MSINLNHLFFVININALALTDRFTLNGGTSGGALGTMHLGGRDSWATGPSNPTFKFISNHRLLVLVVADE